tara:strand:- start:46 stop:450 length:405 start_codon:yes stop_codon:yes gene_type:complete
VAIINIKRGRIRIDNIDYRIPDLPSKVTFKEYPYQASEGLVLDLHLVKRKELSDQDLPLDGIIKKYTKQVQIMAKELGCSKENFNELQSLADKLNYALPSGIVASVGLEVTLKVQPPVFLALYSTDDHILRYEI